MIEITLNGTTRKLDLDPEMPLLWALRDHLDLTGTKFGCGAAQCGACTVLVDGVATRSCLTTIDMVKGQKVTTIEGLSGKVGSAITAAWIKLEVAQCGYCQSGQIMSAAALLETNRKPTDADIDAAMSGNLCRCATYQRIRGAIHEAARMLDV
ncbi:MAG: (2Fe-2S)-binding protein [Bosea sp. (in: a-proteobacteria)]